MKYMLMMHVPGGEPYQIARWPAADITAHIAYMRKFAGKLSDAGELVWAEGLSGPDQAKRVRAGAIGEPIIDNEFPESKEFLAGYWVVDVETPERAYAKLDGQVQSREYPRPDLDGTGSSSEPRTRAGGHASKPVRLERQSHPASREITQERRPT